MLEAMLEAEQEAAPFTALAELRTEHSNLLRDSRKEDGAAIADRVADFIRRAQATGRNIESQADRDAAQGIVDYWAAWQFSKASKEALSASPPTLADFVPQETPPRKPAENPYVGLRAFEEKDAGYFVGREEATRSLLERLKDNPIIFLSGAVGSGKSSLVLAGLVPRLRARGVLETRKEPVFPLVTPGADPLSSLLRGLLDTATAKPADPDAWLAESRARLQRAPGSLRDIAVSILPDTDIVLIVDQFEELFTLCEDLPLRDRFCEAMVALVADGGSRNRVILIIREDYAQRAYTVPALESYAKRPGAQFSPPQPTGAELVRLIATTAETAGLKFDEGIVEDIAQDVAGEAASLPTLQFTLSRLWSALPQDSNRITRDIYRQVGKPRAALARAAEAVFDSLTATQQQVAQHLFLELMQPATGEEVRRRRISRETLIQLTGDSADDVNVVLDRFEKAELVRKTRSAIPDDDKFEVPHEALVNNWNRLDGWLKDKRRDSQKKLQLVTTARLWMESGQSPGYLLTGNAVGDAMPYRDAAPELRELIAASEKADRRDSRFKWIGGTLAAVLFFAGGLWLVMLAASDSRLRTDFDERDGQIQKLNDELAFAEARANENEASLRQAQETIESQQKQIEDLLRRLLAADAPLPAPVPAPRQFAAAPKEIASSQEGWIWIGSEQKPNLRDPNSSAPVLPAAITPGTRYALSRNVVLRSDKPAEDYTQAQSLGVVPNETVVTALDKAVAYDRPSGTRQHWLRVRVTPSDKPIVYFQYDNLSRADAQALADAIQSRGYRVPGVQNLDLAKGMNEVRYYFEKDRDNARKLADNITKVLNERGLHKKPTRVVDLTGNSFPRTYPGVIEFWFDPAGSP